MAVRDDRFDADPLLAAQLTGEISDGDTVVLDLSDAETARISVAAGVSA